MFFTKSANALSPLISYLKRLNRTSSKGIFSNESGEADSPNFSGSRKLCKKFNVHIEKSKGMCITYITNSLNTLIFI